MKYLIFSSFLVACLTGCGPSTQDLLDQQVVENTQALSEQALQRQQMQREREAREKQLSQEGIATGPIEGRRPYIGPRYGDPK